jgi:protein-S-isoprenylcysteine O-methyltransferase Ste14
VTAELKLLCAWWATLRTRQQCAAILGVIAIVAATTHAPFEYRAHSEFDRIRGLPVRRFTGIVYAPAWIGPESRSAPIGPTWVIEDDHDVDTLDAVHLELPRLATWWAMALLLTVDLVLAGDARASAKSRVPTDADHPQTPQAPQRGKRHFLVPVLVQAITLAALAVWFFAIDGGVWRVRHTVGVLIVIPSTVVWILGRYQLGSAFTTRAEARTLITTGVYARIRNPIYIAAEVQWAGLVVFVGLWFLIALWLVTIPVQLRRARREASVLEVAFGERYREYVRRTWF